MAELKIVNPVAVPAGPERPEDRFAAASRPGSLDGLTVGLFWNGKSHGDVALRHTEVALAKLFPTTRFVHYLGDRGGMTRFASEPLRESIVRECDVIVGASADCGSCTSYLIRDLAAFEARGLPTVAWVASGFVKDARWSSEIFGCPELAIAEVPLPFTNREPAHIDQMVEDGIGAVIKGLTSDGLEVTPLPDLEKLHLDDRPTFAYVGDDLLECLDRMHEHFLSTGWSDGLPLVPPTPDRVAAMVAASGRVGNEVIGLFDPGRGVGTVEKIAANAVMAGASPDAMPVILAMAECVLDPAMGLRTWAMSTGPQAPVVMVSGPISDQIGMNNGICALGPGSVSAVNIAIGRTLRLMMMNVGHSYPGISDMDTIGTPLKFSACVAENEARNPWEPYRVLHGFDATTSTVSVNVPYGVCELFDFENHEPERLITSFCTVTNSVSASPHPGNWLIKTNADLSAGYPFNGKTHNLILMCPEHAEAFASAGWTVDDIKRALHKGSRRPFREAMINKGTVLFEAAHPELQWLLDTPDTDVSLYPGPDCFDIFVVGGAAGRSLYFHGGTMSVSKEVRLPA